VSADASVKTIGEIMPGEFRARVPEGSITGSRAGEGPPVLILPGGPGPSDYTAPPLRLSAECHAGTFASIRSHFDQHTLERSLPALTVPALFLLGAASPIPARHGVASAGLERPGSVRKALERIR